MFDIKPFEEKMKKSISVLEEDFDTIRVGRAIAKVLDKIPVPYYGTPPGIDGVATI
jgi:ribosome recycling factor